MRQDHRFSKKKRLTGEQRRLLPMAGLLITAVVLTIIIVIAEHGDSGQSMAFSKNMPSDGAGSGSGSAGASASYTGQRLSEEENSHDRAAGLTETDILQKDPMPELVDIMKRYFEARMMADAQTLNELYGITGISEDTLEEQKLKLLSNAKYVSGFSNVTTYVMDGTDENNWLVYTTADIQFYATSTSAPMIMWCFIQREADGNFRILDPARISSAMQEFALDANHRNEVRRMASDINGRLRDALAADADLASVYGILHEGSPVWEDDKDEVVVLDEDGNAGGDEIILETDAGGDDASSIEEPIVSIEEGLTETDTLSEETDDNGGTIAGDSEGNPMETPEGSSASAGLE